VWPKKIVKVLDQIGQWWHDVTNTLATPLLVRTSDAPTWRVFFFRIFPPLRRRRYLKPALSYDQQIDLLERRGLVIGDRARAMRWLSRTNYYRFSAYLFPFRNSDDTYAAGTSFDLICTTYNFDRKLRLLVMDAIERVEIWLRTAITYELAHHCGPFGYLQKDHFKRGFDHSAFMEKLREEQRRSNETFVVHYRKKYDGENYLPVWMVTELLTLGSLSHLYSALPLELKKRIAASIKVDEKVLTGWLHSIGYVRNICAHHSRLWNRTLAIKPRCPKRWVYGRIDNGQIYLLLVVLGYVLGKIAPSSSWYSRLVQLMDLHPDIVATAMGFPGDWKSKEPWLSA
jgi:abortive infection bacteriophage resistance protein